MPQHDEALKGAPDVSRSHAHFDMLKDENLEKFDAALKENFYIIDDEVTKPDKRAKILDWMKSDQFAVHIPAWNEEDTLPPILKFMAEQLGDAKKITVMDADSTDQTAKVAGEVGVNVITQSDMFKCIKRDALVDVLNDPNPRGRGMTLYAFWIYRHLIQETNLPKYVAYSDSDIKNYPEYDALPYMAYPIVIDGKPFTYTKIGKPGRNNEPVFAGRCAMRAVSPAGMHYFERLSRDMWMISGEYLVSVEHMKNQVHTTRSFVDTTTAMYYADLEAAGKGPVAIVASNRSRIDKKNDNLKEQAILYSIATNLVGYATLGKKVAELTIDDLRTLNTKVFPQLSVFPYIPEAADAPMQSTQIMNDRYIPSIQQMLDNAWVDFDQVKAMKKKYGF